MEGLYCWLFSDNQMVFVIIILNFPSFLWFSTSCVEEGVVLLHKGGFQYNNSININSFIVLIWKLTKKQS